MATERKLYSRLAVPPAAHLEEFMEERGISIQAMADQLGCPEKFLQRLLKGKEGMTESLAAKLEEITGMPAYLFVKLEERYRETLWRNAQKRRAS